MAPHDELKMLRNEARECETALEEIRARIDELEQERSRMRKE
jgi:predicted nuclease with TOPRIM domain